MDKPGFSADRFINSPFAAVFTAGITSLLLHVSRNMFAYSYTQIFVSLTAQIAMSLLTALLVIPIRMMIRHATEWLQTRLSQQRTAGPARMAPAILIRLAGLHWTDMFTLAFVVLWMYPPSAHLPPAGACPSQLFTAGVKILVAAAGLLVLCRGIRPLNLILLPLFFIALGNFPFVVFREIMDARAPVAHSERLVTFKTRPNVYVFFLESYTGKDALRMFYEIDADPIYRDLARLGFSTHDTYASRTFTAAGAATLMRMRHITHLPIIGRLDMKKPVYQMISGITYNPVIEQFKRNGYRIAFLQKDLYVYRFKSPAVEASNLDAVFTGFQYYLTPLSDSILRNVKILHALKQPLSETIKPDIRHLIDDHHPTFFFVYSGLDHIRDGQTREEFVDCYRTLYNNFNLQLMDLLAFINKEDPEAVVVLTGDHGGHSYGLNNFLGNRRATNKLSPDMIARDAASVLFAIKNPVKNKTWQEVEQRPFTHVNLFRYLFAILADDRTLLDTAEPDISLYVNNSIIVRNNQPLKKWEPNPQP
jgi:hypothetical protein